MVRKPEIAECLFLLQKLEKEFPEEPDLEALHSVTGIYAKLKQYREQIAQFPKPVQAFCRFLHAAACPSVEMAAFLEFLRTHPGAFSTAEGGTFLEKRQRISAVADQAGLDAARAFHLVSLARLKGLLDKKNELAEGYASLLADYLGELQA